jgi:hypothetical protein
MKIYNIQSYQNNKITYKSVKPEPPLPKAIIDFYGLNLETMVGYTGEKALIPAPENIKEELVQFLNKFGVDWRTHIKNQPEGLKIL